MREDVEVASAEKNIFHDVPTLHRTAEEVYTVDDLRERLAGAKPMRIKYGVDVTAPFLHIGHAVNLWAMRELQDLGHKVVLLIGDFTTTIGDPTGKSKTRPRIQQAQIEKDAESFIAQVGTILRTDPAVLEVRRNSEWWASMSLGRFMELASMVTHSRLIQRDMFQRRIAQNHEIFMHEMLYPVLQGYDSYELEADLTIVGTEQLFNEMMGRFYQERLDMKPQSIVTTRITPGLDGREKQSKSLGNYIAISDTPRDKFGKIMSLPDELVIQYLEVYTLVPLDEVARWREAMAAGSANAMEAKRFLGHALVERYHGEEAAAREDEWFVQVFSRRSVPDDVPQVTIDSPDATLADVLRSCLPEESSSAVRRLIQQGGVQLNGAERLTDPVAQRMIRNGDVIRVGKRRWFRVTFAD